MDAKRCIQSRVVKLCKTDQNHSCPASHFNGTLSKNYTLRNMYFGYGNKLGYTRTFYLRFFY